MRIARAPLQAAEAAQQGVGPPQQPPSESTAALPPLAILADLPPVAHLVEQACGVDPDFNLDEAAALGPDALGCNREAVQFNPAAAAALTNLPTPLTSFVGRERELAEVSGLLQEGSSARRVPSGDPDRRGGSGKTRLAIQVARPMVQQRRHGVWWGSQYAARPGPPARDGAGRAGSEPAPASRPCTRSPASCTSAACCWCSTTASTWPRPALTWRHRSWVPVRTSRCWPPAVSPWVSPASSSGRCRPSPSRLRPQTRTRTACSVTMRSGCS